MNCFTMYMYEHCMYINIYTQDYTREIPAFGGFSLALRGSGAVGAPIWETAAFGGGERNEE